MADDDTLVGYQVKAWRSLRAMSQADLAQRMTLAGHPMQQQTVLEVEKGSRPLLLTEAVVLARILGADLVSLTTSSREQDLLLRAEQVATRVQEMRDTMVQLGAEAQQESAVLAALVEALLEMPDVEVPEWILGWQGLTPWDLLADE